MKLGILQTDDVNPDLAARYGEYPDMFIALLAPVAPELIFTTYAVHRGEYPARLEDADAYLITGSKAGVYDDAPWIHQLKEFVCRAHAERRKLIGICFGHQMVAHALGGRAGKSRRGWGIGRHSYTLTDRAGQYATAGNQFSILASHQDQVTEPAPGAEVLAGSAFCPIAMTQIDNHVLTFQGHPEFEPGYAEGLMALRRSAYGEALYQNGLASLSLPLDQWQVAQWMVDFLHR